MKNITIDQWNAHASFADDLKALLANPVMETALQVAFDQGFATIPAMGNPGGNLVDYFALQGAIREGYRLAFQNIRNLSRPKVDRPKVQPKAWASAPQPEEKKA